MKAILSMVVALGLSAVLAGAQQYTLDWYTVDAGGGSSQGGSYTLSGTIGQPDAGVMSGGPYTLQGGFWPGVVVTSPGDAPTLFIQLAPAGATVSWAPASSDYLLEQTDTLGTGQWVPAEPGNPVTVPLTGEARYYRLRRP